MTSFRYSLDGGETWSDPVATSKPFTIPGTAVQIEFTKATPNIDKPIDSITVNLGSVALRRAK